MRDLATAPPIAPPRFSLLSAVETVDEPDLRWQGGYSYLSELIGASNHGAAGINLAECYEWTQPLEAPDPAGADNRQVWADPIIVWAGDRCSTLSSGWRRDAEGRVRRQLLAHQSAILADRVWAAGIGQATLGDTEDHIGNVLVGTSALDALACLEERLHDSLQGPIAYVHLGPAVLTLLVAAGAVRLDGSRYVTPMGSIVVADAGYAYQGVAPGFEGSWMVGTGPVRVRLGPIETSPSEAGDFAPAMNVLTNDIAVLAYRAATVEVDRFVHVAARIDVTC